MKRVKIFRYATTTDDYITGFNAQTEPNWSFGLLADVKDHSYSVAQRTRLLSPHCDEQTSSETGKLINVGAKLIVNTAINPV